MTTRLPAEDDPVTLKDACEIVLYSVQEVADRLGKTRPWVHRWADNYPKDSHGQPTYITMGNRKLFTEPDIARIQEHIEKGIARSLTGQVYFVEAGDFIKIGYTQSRVSRLRRMSTDTPYELVVLHTEFGTYGWERTLHRQFAHLRVRREWFRKSPEILEWIKKRVRFKLGLD